MQFTFETTITETKGAVNTCKKVAEILKNSNVTFGTLKDSDVPGIWVTFPPKKEGEDGEKKWVANMQSPLYFDDHMMAVKYGDWWVTYSKQPNSFGQEYYLFSHLTDAARDMVKAWIRELVDEYERRLAADAPEHG